MNPRCNSVSEPFLSEPAPGLSSQPASSGFTASRRRSVRSERLRSAGIPRGSCEPSCAPPPRRPAVVRARGPNLVANGAARTQVVVQASALDPCGAVVCGPRPYDVVHIDDTKLDFSVSRSNLTSSRMVLETLATDHGPGHDWSRLDRVRALVRSAFRSLDADRRLPS